MERLRLIPAEHWVGDRLEGVSIYVLKEGDGFVGCFVFKPIELEKAATLAARHLRDAGYGTTTLLYSEEIEGISFGKTKPPITK